MQNLNGAGRNRRDIDVHPMKERLIEAQEIKKAVNLYFKDMNTTNPWLTSRKSMRGNKTPTEMIIEGQFKKLKAFVDSCLEDKTPTEMSIEGRFKKLKARVDSCLDDNTR